MKTIVHVAGNMLLRPNGISRYIRSCADYGKSINQEHVLLSDSKPHDYLSKNITTFYDTEADLYSGLGMHPTNDHVWLAPDNNVVEQLKQVVAQWAASTDAKRIVYVSHDYHAAQALEQLAPSATRIVHVNHESDIQFTNYRFSYVNDDWISGHTKLFSETNNFVGLVNRNGDIVAKNPLFLPMPWKKVKHNITHKREGLVYIGDSSYRKGVDRFLNVAKQLDTKVTIISHDDSPMFEGFNRVSFDLDEYDDMLALVSQHKCAYIPARGESLCLAAFEALTVTNLVLPQERWTYEASLAGATVVKEEMAASAVEKALSSKMAPITLLVQDYKKRANQIWARL
jgi:hypothetical protein